MRQVIWYVLIAFTPIWIAFGSYEYQRIRAEIKKERDHEQR